MVSDLWVPLQPPGVRGNVSEERNREVSWEQRKSLTRLFTTMITGRKESTRSSDHITW